MTAGLPAKSNAKAKNARTAKKTTHSFRNRWRMGRQQRGSSDLPSVWRLLGDTYRMLIRYWRPLGGVVVIYALFYFLFVRAAPAVDLGEYRQLIDDTIGASSTTITTLTLAGVALASTSQASTEVNTVYGLVLFVIVSLALIWTLRHLFAKKKFNLRDAYYRGMTPFITYALMLLLIAVQLLPFALGGLLFALVQSQGITVGGVEDLIFVLIWLLMGLISGWLVANSIMASYAVTLPGMYPWAALKATKELVKRRRWEILRKILFLPMVLFALFFIGFLFLIAVAPGTALWFIDLALIVAIPVGHTYFYNLYRSLV